MPFVNLEDKRKYQREWKARRRAEYFADKCCAKCGSCVDLQLDHLDPSSKVSHQIWSWSAPRREAELVKCQVLCSDCHKVKTFTIDLPAQGRCTPTDGVSHHGTWGRYRRGCRCGMCRLKAAFYKRSLRSPPL